MITVSFMIFFFVFLTNSVDNFVRDEMYKVLHRSQTNVKLYLENDFDNIDDKEVLKLDKDDSFENSNTIEKENQITEESQPKEILLPKSEIIQKENDELSEDVDAEIEKALESEENEENDKNNENEDDEYGNDFDNNIE